MSLQSRLFPVSNPGAQSFDLDLLVECDDEYWEPSDPHAGAFVQPPGKPAAVTFFNHMLSLNQIQAYALRTIVRGFLCAVFSQHSILDDPSTPPQSLGRY